MRRREEEGSKGRLYMQAIGPMVSITSKQTNKKLSPSINFLFFLGNIETIIIKHEYGVSWNAKIGVEVRGLTISN